MKLGIIGARGHVGAELLGLLAQHTGFELCAVSSRQLVGQRVCDVFAHPAELQIEELTPVDAAARRLDAWVLALPNGLSAPFVEAIGEEAAIVDLSADHRFDDAWTYGLTEHHRAAIRATRRVANPGCYATGAQVALRPLLDLLEGPAHVFGVSGYSGAGTTPSERNDPERLADNLMPYALTGHTHELEVSRHLGHTVHFMPHVASFFRGISLTVSATSKAGTTRAELEARLRAAAADEPLLEYTDAIPQVRAAVGKHGVRLGGLSFDEGRRHLVLVSTLDNLLKGAATQALQNLNLMCGFDELEGIVS